MRPGWRRAIAAVLALAGPALPAVAAVSIAIAPPYVERTVPAGAAARDSVSFTNQGTEPVVVEVDVADFAVDESGQVTEQPPGSDATSLVPYLRLAPSRVRVAPGQRVHFRYAVEAPEAFAQLRAMVFFSSVPEIPPGDNRVRVVARMGLPLYVENRKAQPGRLEIDSLVWTRDADRPDRLRAALSLRNLGQRNLRPQGDVHVRAVDGSFRRSFPFNPGREPVLPGQRRRWEQNFGPVSAGELIIELRLATSARTSYRAESRVPAAAAAAAR